MYTLLGVSWGPFPRNVKATALLWPKHGPHMVLLNGSSRILINMPRNAPCQIQIVSIYIDRYIQLSDSCSKLLIKSVSDGERFRDLPLARGQG